MSDMPSAETEEDCWLVWRDGGFSADNDNMFVTFCVH